MSKAAEPRTVSAVRASFHERSALSMTLFVVSCVFVLFAVVGLLIKQPMWATRLLGFVACGVLLICTYFLHGRRFDLDPKQRLLRVTTVWLCTFEGRSATYSFSDVEEVRTEPHVEVPDWETCIVKLRSGKTHELYGASRYDLIRQLFEAAQQTTETRFRRARLF